MHQLRMFRLAPEALTINAHHVGGEGWFLKIQMRRADETWAEAYTEQYERLTTHELVDVLDAVTTRCL